jgi:multiple sugar transport system substrate-binding protein
MTNARPEGTRIALAAALAMLAFGCSRPPHRTEIVFWQSRPEAAVAPLLRQFEAEHPDFAVTLRRLPAFEMEDSLEEALQSGHVPDLVECPSRLMPRLVAGSMLADWSAGVADLRDSVRGWAMCSRGETLYGLPWVLEPRMLFFNRSLFARAGLDSARPPETWADLAHAAASIERLARRTHRGDVHGLGLGEAGSEQQFEDFMPLAWGRGGDILSADLDSSRFDSPENRAALAFALRLRHDGEYGTGEQLGRDFVAGRLGLLCADGALAGEIAPGTLDFGVTLIPRPETDQGQHASIARGGVLASFRGSRQKEAALRLARFLIAPDRVRSVTAGEIGVVPASFGPSTAPTDGSEGLEAAMVRQAQDVHFPPNHAAWDSMQIAIEGGLADAWADSLAPPDSAAAHATAAVDRRLAELLSRR